MDGGRGLLLLLYEEGRIFFPKSAVRFSKTFVAKCVFAIRFEIWPKTGTLLSSEVVTGIFTKRVYTNERFPETRFKYPRVK